MFKEPREEDADPDEEEDVEAEAELELELEEEGAEEVEVPGEEEDAGRRSPRPHCWRRRRLLLLLQGEGIDGRMERRRVSESIRQEEGGVRTTYRTRARSASGGNWERGADWRAVETRRGGWMLGSGNRAA